MKDGRIGNNETKIYLKLLKIWRVGKLVCWPSDNEYFDFTEFGPLSSFYLKLMNGNIGINVAKLNMKEVENRIDSLKRKKAKKSTYKKNKEDVFKSARALYDRMNIIVDAFKRLVFESKHFPDISVDYESDIDDKDDFDFQIPREVTPRNLIPDFGIDTLFNNKYEQLDMPDLECEESAAQTRKQTAAGLKILTPCQMLRRLPFF